MKTNVTLTLIAIILFSIAAQSSVDQLQLCTIEGTITPQAATPAGEVLLEESFEEQFPPADWKVLSFGTSAQQWRPNDDIARTGSYCALMSWVQEDGTTDEWLVTKAIDLSQVSGARLFFYESETYWSYGLEHTIRVSTTSQDDPSAFETIDTMIPDNHTINGFGGAAVELDLSKFVGNSTVYVAFCYGTEVADLWYIDDISVVVPFEHDVRANTIVVDNHVEGGKLTLLQAVVENVGLATESFEVEFGHFEWDGSETILRTKSVTDLVPGAKKNISFGFYKFTKDVEFTYFMRTKLNTDMMPDNDRVDKNIESFSAYRSAVLAEQFTSTGCVHCPKASKSLKRISNEQPGRFYVISYHGHFGNDPDPFTTAESYERMDVYDFAGYPTVIFDGIFPYVGVLIGSWEDTYAWYKKRFNTEISKPTLFDIDLTLEFK
jgi:hypothetical protein